MQYSVESEIVISFFNIILLMVKHPESKRTIDWNMRFFSKEADAAKNNPQLFWAVSRMIEELDLCRRRKRSRFWLYNASDIDSVCAQYHINKSQTTLWNAWELFRTERYKVV